jgi:hypothetical protein
MKIYVVSEMDERDESFSVGPLSAYTDEDRAKVAASKFNQGKPVGHYAIVVPVELD